MFFLRLNLLQLMQYMCLMHILKAYPMQPYKAKKFADAAEYPDLTNGLSDAELEAALNGLSLDDLNNLDKYLDNKMEDNDNFDGVRMRQRHVKRIKQPEEELGNIELGSDDTYDPAEKLDRERGSKLHKSAFDDSCNDDSDPTKERPEHCKNKLAERPKCTKKPKCTGTTERCPLKSNLDLCKSKGGGAVMDDDYDRLPKCPDKTTCKPKKKPKKKPICEEECDPEDELCLQRNFKNLKQQNPERTLKDYDLINDKAVDDMSDYSLGHTKLDESDELGDIAEGAMPPMKLKKELAGWKPKKELELEILNTDYNKLPSFETRGAEIGDFKYNRKLGNGFDILGVRKMSDDTPLTENREQLQEEQVNELTNVGPDFIAIPPMKVEGQPAASSGNNQKAGPFNAEQNIRSGKVDDTSVGMNNQPAAYERHQLSRLAHEQGQRFNEEQTAKVEDNRNLEDSAVSENDNIQLDESLTGREEGLEAGTIAAETPKLSQSIMDGTKSRELEQKANILNDGESFIANSARDPPRYFIQTPNGFIKSDNEPGQRRLRSDENNSEMLNFNNFEQLQFVKEKQYAEEWRRRKRENKKTDDAPENSKETYLKKLMDSFPRDTGSQSNANIARMAESAHVRVKRS
ncbi:uncharacterized protein LOC115630506 isoform X2 [Scaptodrosophila lebanonensis]|uniref:Uncharacterized protein LOC115630506 isoform X2 n=1 Tax=Drosophila lebanonensis TaxID=7225 RepID=A0A6J2U3H6_DROLE|nr:uncharacterized protein LOC115630506 isoform X2 [Scaptodrosophila lebanonensis]